MVRIKPIPVAARSKAWVCSRCIDGSAGSNPPGDMDVCLLSVSCMSGRGLCVELHRSLPESGVS